MAAAGWDEKVEELAARVLDWADSVLSLDERSVPSEFRRELSDMVVDFHDLLADADEADHPATLERVWVCQEMTEVSYQYPRLLPRLEDELGMELARLLDAEADSDGDDDEDDED